MKCIIVSLFLIFCSTSVQALDGKLTLQNNFYDGGKHYRPLIGLGLYQKITKHTAINAWSGMSEEPFEHRNDAAWWVGKAQVDFYFGRFTISPGYQMRHLFRQGEDRDYMYVRVDYKLF